MGGAFIATPGPALGHGGSGIVVIRYQINSISSVRATGGVVSYYGGKTIHTFTSSGTFATESNWSATYVEYVVIAGGGGGGVGGNAEGGGGGGGSSCRPKNPGRNGGSGGGAMGNCAGSSNPPGGSGNTPPVSPPQGSDGGNGGNGVTGGNAGVSGGGGGGPGDAGGSGNTPPTDPPQGNDGGQSGGGNNCGAGGGGAASTTVEAPDFNVVGAGTGSQLAQAVGAAQSRPFRAYVVSSEVSSAQEFDRKTVNQATLG